MSTDILGLLPTSPTLPFDTYTLAVHILPVFLSFYVVAVLVILSGTHMLRIALCPLVIFLAFRATTFVDSFCRDSQWAQLNIGFALVMLFIVMRTLEWMFLKDPLKRHVKSASLILIDALDLTMNVRGVGWNWSKGLRLPPETRPTSRPLFAVYVLLSAIYHSFICGVLHIAIQTFAPEAFTVLSGGTIFDDTLPPLIRYIRSSIISTLALLAIYSAIQMNYDVGAFVGVTVIQQDPAQWPPLFDEPWKATSLRDFWSYRWHQLVRRSFITLGGWPIGFVFGRVGYILGSFLASGILHHIVIALHNRSVEWWNMPLSFGMMAVAVIIEQMFTRMTGNKVGGWIGRVWTIAWLLIWGNMMVDGFARAGLFASSSAFGTAALTKGIVAHYVTALDKWLRMCAS
ncbi:hypothetical protein EDC04DRAFT_3102770 [Pisolithus marmoratus]|nr:hypothetical protein EDC04DRAFT_3102770 [Pisolithus marmoratus]